VFCRRWFSVAILLGAFLHIFQARAFAQPDPVTADQVIARYLDAIGADHFPSITTFAEKGDLSGNVTNFSQGALRPEQPLNRERGSFESYFKAPNLRLRRTFRENNIVFEMQGCDGKVAWHIGSDGHPSELKLQPGSEDECEKGYEPLPLRVRAPSLRIELKGKKKVGDQTAWKVEIQDPKSSAPETYYFDAQTYFLLRYESGPSYSFGRYLSHGVTRLYSDYRDVGGIKLPFTVIERFENSELVTTVREVKIDAPIDDARFAEPKGDLRVRAESPPPAAKTTETEIYNITSPETPAAPVANSVTEVNIPKFASCSIAELQRMVPELRRLKPAPDQEKLAALLDKVGAKTLDLARKTPNLISHEAVVESRQGIVQSRQNFSYLILSRPQGRNAVTLDEFRVDLKSGEKFQTDDDAAEKAAASSSSASSPWADLARASQQLAASQAGRGPQSQGFANMWVFFYPLNRPESTFRYLGEQKMDGLHTLVLAFEQNPKSVRSPAEFRVEGTATPIFFQGVAWVDASDFRIVRLRTDLLSPLPEVYLRRLTAEIQFAETRIAEVASPLSLPREVVVTSEVSGMTLRDDHKYSDYRLFRTHSKIVLNP
jgi:hypothetical protein